MDGTYIGALAVWRKVCLQMAQAMLQAATFYRAIPLARLRPGWRCGRGRAGARTPLSCDLATFLSFWLRSRFCAAFAPYYGVSTAMRQFQQSPGKARTLPML